MLAHADEEERQPTEDEMNHMIDEMRLRFYEVYGPDAYNPAISQVTERLIMSAASPFPPN